MRVLYVEDNALDADLTRRALHRASPHIVVEGVPTQLEALKRLNPANAIPYDLVLTDVRLPDGDGLAILAHILRHNLPLAAVIVTGSSDEQLVVAALKAGASDFVVKRPGYQDQLPFTLERAWQSYQTQVARRGRLLRVLYVEDNLRDIELTKTHLARFAPHIQLEIVGHMFAVFDRLKSPSPNWACDLILLDYRLPGLNALEALKELRQQYRFDLPIVFITSQGDEEVALQALKLGASDYIVKNPGYLARLTSVLENAFYQAQLYREQLALRESEQRYRTLVEKMGEGLVQVDNHDVILYVNDRYCELVGYAREELVGKVSHKLVLLEEDHALLMEKNRARGKGLSERYELRLRTKTGEIIWCEVSGAPVADANGNMIGTFGIHTDITERKHSEIALQRYATRMEILHGIDRSILASHSSEEIAIAALSGIRRLVPCTRATVVKFDLANQSFNLLAVSSDKPTLITAPAETVMRLLGDLNDFQQGQPYEISDLAAVTSQHPIFKEIFESGTRCLISFPLIAQRQVIGALSLEANQKAAFSAEHIEVLYEVSNQLAIALQQTQLFSETNEALQREQRLNEVARTISGTLEADAIIPNVVRLAAELVWAEAGTLSLLDASGEMLTIPYAYNYPRSQQIHLLPKSEGGVAWRVIESGQSVLLNNYAAHPQAVPNSPIRAYLSVPVVAHGTVLGTLNLFQLTSLRSFTPRDMALVEAIGRQAGVTFQNARLFEDANRSKKELELAYDATIEGWAHALDLRDQETAGHTQRVTDLTMKLARRMGLPEAEMIHLQRGALLHDIGKMGIPDGILLKPGPLTDEEFSIMRQHPQYAYNMLWPIAYLRPALDIPYCHHEKWDGSGYPRGLKGTAIPLAARIFAIVDVWDALRSERPYRAAWSEARVRGHVVSLAGTHFDPLVAETFLTVIDE